MRAIAAVRRQYHVVYPQGYGKNIGLVLKQFYGRTGLMFAPRRLHERIFLNDRASAKIGQVGGRIHQPKITKIHPVA